MSLLIVIMNSATHDASSVVAAVPSNQSQLYDMAINTVLKAKDEQTWQVAKKVLSKIAFRKMLHKTKPKNPTTRKQKDKRLNSKRIHSTSKRVSKRRKKAPLPAEIDGSDNNAENHRIFTEAEVQTVLSDREEVVVVVARRCSGGGG